MIDLPVPTYTMADLTYEPARNVPAMLRELEIAVRACAKLNDPLAYLLPVRERNEATMSLARSLAWLYESVLFRVDFHDELAELNAHNEGGATFRDASKWTTNISNLAAELIRANYDRGWDGTHDIFKLTYLPLSKRSVGGYDLAMVDRASDWPLFVQAVIAQQWVDNATEEQDAKAFEKAARIAWATGLREGAVIKLAQSYYNLGIANSEGAYVLSGDNLRDAVEMWRVNITNAAHILENLFKAS